MSVDCYYHYYVEVEIKITVFGYPYKVMLLLLTRLYPCVITNVMQFGSNHIVKHIVCSFFLV
jgi:hypothetical protein